MRNSFSSGEILSYKCETLTRSGPCSRESASARASAQKSTQQTKKRKQPPALARDRHEYKALFPFPFNIHNSRASLVSIVCKRSEYARGAPFPTGSERGVSRICINLDITIYTNRLSAERYIAGPIVAKISSEFRVSVLQYSLELAGRDGDETVNMIRLKKWGRVFCRGTSS